MKKIGLLFIVMMCLSFIACAIGPTHGMLFTNNDFPGEFNPANNVKSVKTGYGCQISILGLVSVGNAAAGQIAFDSKIERIATIDHSTINVLSVLFARYCTIVTGE
ncbi:MAG: TRL-like family protein [Leptospira sp.]|nr:TRL-like family protein [Leptospira sp.]